MILMERWSINYYRLTAMVTNRTMLVTQTTTTHSIQSLTTTTALTTEIGDLFRNWIRHPIWYWCGEMTSKRMCQGINYWDWTDWLFNTNMSDDGSLLNKLVSVDINSAFATTGRNLGLVGNLKSYPKIPEFLLIHCIIHRKDLIQNILNMMVLWR